MHHAELRLTSPFLQSRNTRSAAWRSALE